MSVDALRADLVRLRGGAGIQTAHLSAKVGEALRAVCAVEASDSDGLMREKISRAVLRACARLTPDDALAVRVALYLEPSCPFRFFQDRMDCLGRLIQRERRTAVRRVDDALQLVAEILVEDQPDPPASRFAPEGWYFTSLSSRLVVGAHSLVLIETREITATVNDLAVLSVAWSTERSDQYDEGFTVDLLEGGRLIPLPERSGDGVWVGQVQLDTVLQSGDTHRYRTMVRMVGDFEPYYIVTPFRRTDHFGLEVEFSGIAQPSDVQRIVGEPARFVTEPNDVREPIVLDAAGIATTSFEQLNLGLSYGLRW